MALAIEYLEPLEGSRFRGRRWHILNMRLHLGLRNRVPREPDKRLPFDGRRIGFLMTLRGHDYGQKWSLLRGGESNTKPEDAALG